MKLIEKYQCLEKEINSTYNLSSRYIDKEIYLDKDELVVNIIDNYEKSTSPVFINKFLVGGEIEAFYPGISDRKFKCSINDFPSLLDRILILEFLNNILEERLNKIIK